MDALLEPPTGTLLKAWLGETTVTLIVEHYANGVSQDDLAYRFAISRQAVNRRINIARRKLESINLWPEQWQTPRIR